jgi:hypothetical protein
MPADVPPTPDPAWDVPLPEASSAVDDATPQRTVAQDEHPAGAQEAEPGELLTDPGEVLTEPVDVPAPTRKARKRQKRGRKRQQKDLKRQAKEQKRERRKRRRRERQRPLVPAYLATVVTGLLVGGAGTGLTAGALRGCEILNGTDSCGGAPGLLVMVAIVAVMVLLGAGLLRLMRVADPAGTSFLAVGIVCVLVLVGLMDVVFSQWMFVGVPVLGAAAYSLAHWVTTRFVDTSEAGPGHDVR